MAKKDERIRGSREGIHACRFKARADERSGEAVAHLEWRLRHYKRLRAGEAAKAGQFLSVDDTVNSVCGIACQITQKLQDQMSVAAVAWIPESGATK